MLLWFSSERSISHETIIFRIFFRFFAVNLGAFFHTFLHYALLFCCFSFALSFFMCAHLQRFVYFVFSILQIKRFAITLGMRMRVRDLHGYVVCMYCVCGWIAQHFTTHSTVEILISYAIAFYFSFYFGGSSSVDLNPVHRKIGRNTIHTV